MQRAEPARDQPCWEGHAAGIERDRGRESSSASLPGLAGDADSGAKALQGHTPTQLQKKLTRGKLQLAGEGTGQAGILHQLSQRIHVPKF